MKIPSSLESEQIILAFCLLQESAEPLGDLSEADFFSEKNRKIFQTIESLAIAKTPINLMEVCRALNENKSSIQVEASSVAALIDGVPTRYETAPYYRDRMKQCASERRTLELGFGIGLLAETGDAAAVIERAQQFAKKDKPNKPTAKSTYPKIPAEAWPASAELYRIAQRGSTEASDNWHFASFYAVVGAILGRYISTRMGKTIYPNLYCVLVGMVGGDGKDTAIDYAVELGAALDQEIYSPRNLDSREGFIQAWTKFIGTASPIHIPIANRAVLRLPEFRGLIEKSEYSGTKSIVTLLNDCYDGPPKVAHETLHTFMNIDNPHLAFLGGTPIQWLREMSDKDLTSGLGRRLIFIPGDPKGPIPDPDPQDSSALNVLCSELRDTICFWKKAGPLSLPLSATAKKLWSDWYQKYKSRCAEDDLIGAMTIGDRTNLRKVALINAGLARSREIEEQHLQPALAFGEFLYEARWPVFSEHGANPNLEIENKMVSKVKAAGGRIPKRLLQQIMRTVDAETFNRRLHFLSQPDGRLQLTQEKGSRSWWVVLTG